MERGARSRADGFLPTAWTCSLFLFFVVFGFVRLRMTAFTVISSSIIPGDMDSRGMLAVFMQLDSSLDEDEYDLTLNIAEMRNLHHQVS